MYQHKAIDQSTIQKGGTTYCENFEKVHFLQNLMFTYFLACW